METGIRCYTDGSKTADGTGSGICIMENDKIIKTRALGLTNNATVFQAEIQAIRLGCSIIQNLPKQPTHITFMIDSQAAITALSNTNITRF